MQATTSADRGFFVDHRPPEDKSIGHEDRNRAVRAGWFWGTLVVIIVAPVLLFWGIGEFFEVPNFGKVIGIVIAAWLLKSIGIKRGLVYNEEYGAYVTQDPLTGGMVPYGPGLHYSKPYEQRNKEGNYSLGVVSKPFVVDVQTKTARITVPGELSYAIDLPNILAAVGIDEETRSSTVETFLKAIIGDRLADHEAQEVLGMTDTINEDLSRNQKLGDAIAKFGTSFGLKIVRVVVGNAKFADATQKTRDALDEADVLFRIVAKMYGYDEADLREKIRTGALTKKEYDKMLNRAMGASDNATMSIQVVESDVPIVLGVDQGKKGGH